MKKGDSVKIEVKSVGEFGIVVHSYKRKEDFSVTYDQLKSKFIERLKPGNPVILRFVSTRPWTLSEKFVHEGRFLFDDYALKPIGNASKPSANSKSEDFENKSQEIASEDKSANDSGLQNKLIVIVKDNQFDKGWTLFSPTSFEIERNWQFKKADLSNIVKLITFSTQVNLVLAETCLPSRVINELEWSNKYIKINIIAKSKEIVDRYKNLTFNSCKIDESLNINYIGITGKSNGYFMLGDDLSEIDESVEKIYFNSTKVTDKYSPLEKAKMMIVCNGGKHQDFVNLLSLSNKYGLKCRYVIRDKYFDRAAYNFAKDNKIELFVSNDVDDVVLIINKDDSISRLSTLNDGYVVLYPIDRISTYVGNLYKNLFLKDSIEVDKIPTDVYSCFNGKNEKLNIVDAVVVKKDVAISEMSDFVNEVFDKSITESHNDYSNKGKTTQYFFTLIPPSFDSSYVESSIYAPIHKLQEEWATLNKIRFDRVVRDYREFMNKDSKLISFIDYSKKFTDKLEEMVKNCSYKGYYSEIEKAIGIYEDYQCEKVEDIPIIGILGNEFMQKHSLVIDYNEYTLHSSNATPENLNISECDFFFPMGIGLDYYGVPVLSIQKDGQDIVTLADSGSADNILSEKVISKYNIPCRIVCEESSVHGISGSIKAKDAQVTFNLLTSRMEEPELIPYEDHFMISPLSLSIANDSKYGKGNVEIPPIEGILGAPFMAKEGWILDFGAKIIYKPKISSIYTNAV